MGGRRLPIASDGAPFILVPLGLGVVLWWLGWSALAVPFVVVSGFMVWFFRDPERVAADVRGAILAPADGRVMEAGTRVDDAFVGAAQQVSIFLSPLDVHVNRAPIGGLVVSVDHRPGAFLPAYRPEASERNERTILAIQGETARVVVRQIAGILARRIVCRVRVGEKLGVGERFGMIKFGSRTDVVFSAGARLSVRRGDRVRAGETVLAVGE